MRRVAELSRWVAVECFAMDFTDAQFGRGFAVPPGVQARPPDDAADEGEAGEE